jgi:hypothetical protein
MFGSMERLEEGKKVSGWIHFPWFGITEKRVGWNVLDGTHRQKPFCANVNGKIDETTIFI